jgi:phosphate transport system substrate-binding protein
MATDGAIGYADLVWAFFGDIQAGAVQNKDKSAYIYPQSKNMTAVAKEQLSAVNKDDLSFDLIDKAGKESYPITGAVWAVCYQKQSAANRKEVHDFLKWVLHEGQKLTSAIYAPLPEELIEKGDEKIRTLTSAK